MQLHPEQIKSYWGRTESHRAHVASNMREAGFMGLDLATFFHDLPSVSSPNVTAENEEQAVQRIARQINDPRRAEFNGFYLLDIGRALKNEARLAEAMRIAIGSMPYRQMAALKANHSLPLQYARLQNNPDAGIEVASAAEAVAASSLGFDPKNIIFANTTTNPRELLACSRLGITAFCMASRCFGLYRNAAVSSSNVPQSCFAASSFIAGSFLASTIFPSVLCQYSARPSPRCVAHQSGVCAPASRPSIMRRCIVPSLCRSAWRNHWPRVL